MFHHEHHRIHISLRSDGKWEVFISGESRNFVGDTKDEALDCAREISKERGLEMIPHAPDSEAFFSSWAEEEYEDEPDCDIFEGRTNDN